MAGKIIKLDVFSLVDYWTSDILSYRQSNFVSQHES